MFNEIDFALSEEMKQIGSKSRFYGKFKYITKYCSFCPWCQNEKNEWRCYWGFAMKKLIANKHNLKSRKCEYFGKPSPREEIYYNRLISSKLDELYAKEEKIVMRMNYPNYDSNRKNRTYPGLIGEREFW
ncbi:MAG: hypothetical protein ACOYT4_00595 [Nanoarchaeota archaeon]